MCVQRDKEHDTHVLLQAAFSHSLDGMVHLRTDHSIVRANPRFAQQVNLPLHQLTASPLEAAWPALARVLNACCKCHFRDEQSVPALRVSLPGGEKSRVDVSIFPLPDAPPAGCLLIVRESPPPPSPVLHGTESSACSILLGEEGEEQDIKEWKVVFETVSDGLIVFDQQRRCLAANAAAARVFGIERAQENPGEIRSPSYQLFHPNGRPFRREEYPSYRAVQGEFQRDIRYYFHNSAGQRVDVLTSTAPLTTGKDVPPLCLAVLHDVTESARLQRQLNDARLLAERHAAQWRAVFESLSTGILIYRQCGCYDQANPAALRMFGAESIDELNAHLADPLTSHQKIAARGQDGEPLEVSQAALYRASIKQERFHNMARKWHNLKGEELEVLVSGGPVGDGAEQEQRFVFVITDVSELRRLQRAREEFIQVIAHELRNPLQVIMGLVQLIERKVSQNHQENVRGQIQLLREQVSHLASLADDVLIAYRLDNGRLRVRPREVQLASALANIIFPYEANCEHRILFDPGPGEVMVRTDPQRLSQIISNLLSNAVKHTPAGKRIWVSIGVADDKAIVAVEDEGIGIPPDQLEAVFSGFARVHELPNWRSGGIGLGLYISRNLARRMGGDLWAQTRPQGGAAFRFSLPRIDNSKPG